MKTVYKNNQKGLVRMIIVVIIAIAVLSYYGFDIKDFFTSPQAQKNFSDVWDFIKDTWSTYLAQPAQKLWDIWLTYAWGPFMEMLKRGDHTGVLNP